MSGMTPSQPADSRPDTADLAVNTRRLELRYVDPETLNFAPYNPRKIEGNARSRLRASLQKHGFVDPVIARAEDNLVVGGHQRADIWLHDLNQPEIPVVFLAGLTDTQAKALNIALNNPKLQGKYDAEKLSELVSELRATTDFDLTLTGFALGELDRLTSASDDEGSIISGHLPDDAPASGGTGTGNEGLVVIEIRGGPLAMAPVLELVAQFRQVDGLIVTQTG